MNKRRRSIASRVCIRGTECSATPCSCNTFSHRYHHTRHISSVQGTECTGLCLSKLLKLVGALGFSSDRKILAANHAGVCIWHLHRLHRWLSLTSEMNNCFPLEPFYYLIWIIVVIWFGEYYNLNNYYVLWWLNIIKYEPCFNHIQFGYVKWWICNLFFVACKQVLSAGV
jgi:hypothetical protein